MAELCSLENAFPNIQSGSPFVGGTDPKPTREERRAARKKAKRCGGPALKALEAEGPDTDPDRPAVKRMDNVDSLQHEKEGFQVPKATSIPTAKALVSGSAGYPSYFGKGMDDTEEGFSSYSASAGDDPNYRLQPDLLQQFDMKGLDKAMGPLLPDPNVSDRWKPMTSSGTYTAYEDTMPTAISARPGWANDSSHAVPAEAPLEVPGAARKYVRPVDEKWVSKDDKEDMLERMNQLIGRLDQLEKKRLHNTQAELLLFVGTGVLLLFTFELVGRR